LKAPTSGGGEASRGAIMCRPGPPTLRPTLVSIIYGTSGTKFAVAGELDRAADYKSAIQQSPGGRRSKSALRRPTLRPTLVSITYGTSGAKIAVIFVFRLRCEAHAHLFIMYWWTKGVRCWTTGNICHLFQAGAGAPAVAGAGGAANAETNMGL
jgi:hypothetical protein